MDNDPIKGEAPQPDSVHAHIVCTPGVVGGRPRIDGTRIRVIDVAKAHAGGISPRRICTRFGTRLSLVAVKAALAYYREHQAELDAIYAADDQAFEEGLRRQEARLIRG